MNDTNKLNIQTKTEVQRMLNNGMTQIDKDELEARLDILGYYINKRDTFNYTNSGNAITYKAKSVAINHKKSQACFSNTDSPRDTLKELQHLRCNYFVFFRGIIWEL